tara:strand:- start:4207 stop:4314 length:108 start_codon:yes stop_codon:yes gene_type:complete
MEKDESCCTFDFVWVIKDSSGEIIEISKPFGMFDR